MTGEKSIIYDVARGWESKSVAEQIDAARARQNGPKIIPTTQQLEIERKCDSLLLQRTRVLHNLASCRDERYKKTLTDGLAFLEARLGELGWKA
jgi:hypothetical protein